MEPQASPDLLEKEGHKVDQVDLDHRVFGEPQAREDLLDLRVMLE